MLKIGLTGGIGSGKTAVSNLFKNLGVGIIDTDVIAHDLVSQDPSVLKEIVEAFGEKTLNHNGALDRKKLAQIVFNQKKYKQQLENILHPRIRNEVNNQIQSFRSNNSQYVIVVIPLLFETGFQELIDRILVVTADKKTRIERVKQRDNRSMDEIQSIISNQVDDKTRISEADDIIENNNDFKELESQVYQLHKKYTALSISAK